MAGECTLVRSADDFVMTFENCLDAKRVLEVLGKRPARYGLMLHPDKTRFIDFWPERKGRTTRTAPNCRSTFLTSPTVEVPQGAERGAAADGQKPACSHAARGKGVVPEQPSPPDPRPAKAAVQEDDRSL